MCMQRVFLSQFCAFYGWLLILNYYHGLLAKLSKLLAAILLLGTGAVVEY